MKKHINGAFLILAVVGAGIVMGACEKVDEMPPYKESSASKAYKLPDPTVMTADEVAEFNAIKAEYEAATK